MHWLNNIIEFLSPGWVGSIIGLVGIASAAITFFLSRQRTRLAFRRTGERLLGLSTEGLPAGITVQYRGDNIERLTRSLVVFWNDGEKTILGEDITATDPLRLKFPDDCRVLTATVLKQARLVNEIRAILDHQKTNEVFLSFSFLDSGDGAVVEVLHTSVVKYPEFVGTVRGLPKGLRNLGFIPRPGLYGSIRKIGWLSFGLGFFLALSVTFVPWEQLEKVNVEDTVGSLPIVGVGALWAFLGLRLILLTRRRHPKTLHLDELD